MTDTPDPVPAGNLLTYNLTVGNSGPGAPTSTTVTDALPASMAFDSATPSQGTCSHASGTVTCELGTLANGASATVQIKVRPQTTGHDHQHRERRIRAQRPDARQQHGERHDDGQRRRRPVDHEDRLARPGRGRSAAHLHAGRQQRGAVHRHRRHASRTILPDGLNVNSATTSQGTCSTGGQEGHLQPGQHGERRDAPP